MTWHTVAFLTAAFSATAGAQPKLSIAVSVPQPVYQLVETAKLQVYFTVVNDGEATVDPSIGSSHLFINGKEPNDWNIVINNGIRNSYFTALPPGEILSFTYQLGPRYFASPGIYKIQWQLGSQQSPEIVFRVMAPRP